MTRKYPYYPAWDGGKASPVIMKCVELCHKRWGMTNLGTYVNRDMRDKPGQKSVHATGFACDMGGDIATLEKAWKWFIENSAAIGLAEAHFYKMPNTKFGAGYRCSRGEGKAGVLVYKTAKESAGTGGLWLHIELEDQDPVKWEETFRALKPA